MIVRLHTFTNMFYAPTLSRPTPPRWGAMIDVIFQDPVSFEIFETWIWDDSIWDDSWQARLF